MSTHSPRTSLPARFTPRRLAVALAACSLFSLAQAATTLPTGMQVVRGQASAVTNGNKLTVTNSNGAILNWGSFLDRRAEHRPLRAGECGQQGAQTASSAAIRRTSSAASRATARSGC